MRLPNLYILCAQIPVGHFGQGGNWKLARGQHRIRSKATQVNKHNYMFCTQTSPQSTQKINLINCTLKTKITGVEMFSRVSSKFHLNFANVTQRSFGTIPFVNFECRRHTIHDVSLFLRCELTKTQSPTISRTFKSVT